VQLHRAPPVLSLKQRVNHLPSTLQFIRAPRQRPQHSPEGTAPP
jgi:hypothetical protein